MSEQTHPLAIQLGRALRLHSNVFQRQLEGITQDESLIQPPYGGNCLNWIVGHIVVSRRALFALTGIASPWEPALYERYVRDAQPITAAEDALPLTQLHADFECSSALLLEWLAAVEPALLDAIPAGEKSALGYRLSFHVWHETYHIGQLESLRNLAGKHEKVI